MLGWPARWSGREVWQRGDNQNQPQGEKHLDVILPGRIPTRRVLRQTEYFITSPLYFPLRSVHSVHWAIASSILLPEELQLEHTVSAVKMLVENVSVERFVPLYWNGAIEEWQTLNIAAFRVRETRWSCSERGDNEYNEQVQKKLQSR